MRKFFIALNLITAILAGNVSAQKYCLERPNEALAAKKAMTVLKPFQWHSRGKPIVIDTSVIGTPKGWDYQMEDKVLITQISKGYLLTRTRGTTVIEAIPLSVSSTGLFLKGNAVNDPYKLPDRTVYVMFTKYANSSSKVCEIANGTEKNCKKRFAVEVFLDSPVTNQNVNRPDNSNALEVSWQNDACQIPLAEDDGGDGDEDP